MAASGDFDLLENMLDMHSRTMPSRRAMTRNYYNISGVYWGEYTDIFGADQNVGYIAPLGTNGLDCTKTKRNASWPYWYFPEVSHVRTASFVLNVGVSGKYQYRLLTASFGLVGVEPLQSSQLIGPRSDGHQSLHLLREGHIHAPTVYSGQYRTESASEIAMFAS